MNTGNKSGKTQHVGSKASTSITKKETFRQVNSFLFFGVFSESFARIFIWLIYQHYVCIHISTYMHAYVAIKRHI